MKISCSTLIVIVIVTAVVWCRVSADSEENAGDSKNPVLSKTSGSNDGVNEVVDPVKKSKPSSLDMNDSTKKQLEAGGREDEQKKGSESDKENKVKENEESGSNLKKETKEGSLPLAREKCVSSSNHCTDDDKTFVACLTVPGNESPALSLLIQNKGKVSLNINISAPDLVQLEKKQIELQENKDTEVKVSISGVESGHFIILTAGHGNCSLDFRDQFVSMKKIDDSHPSSHSNIFKLTLSTGFLFVAALLILGASVFMCTKLGRKYFARKGPKYQMLDMELPVSHGSKLESGGNEGWDDSWGDSWDDEEAPSTPSLPVTPSLSSKGMTPRKISKEGWKD